MKHTLFSCMLIFYSCITANAQYDSAIQYRMSPSFFTAMDTLIARAGGIADTGDESPSYLLKRQKFFLGSRISNDVAPGADITAPMGAALRTYRSFMGACTGYGNWNCVGPFTNEYGSAIGMGRIISLWVDPDDSSTILAGSDGGGLWKSVNDGHNWHCITDGAGNNILSMPGVSCIAVNPLNKNIIYIALGTNSQYKKSYGYTLGLAYTTDGGVTWNTDDAFDSTSGLGLSPAITKVAYMPGTQHLFAISKEQVLYKADSTAIWQDITPIAFTPNSRWCFDLGFTQYTTGKAIVSFGAINDTSYLGIYNPGTGWTLLPIVLASPYTHQPYGGITGFSVSARDTAYCAISAWYHTSSTDSTNVTLFEKTAVSAINLYMLNTSLAPYPQVVQQFAVSQGNSQVIYTANYTSATVHRRFTQSIHEGTDSTGYFPEIYSGEHDDGRCLYIWHSYQNPDSDMVYFGCDGGVCKKRMGATHTKSITGDSLCITEFYGFGNTEADENIMTGGSEDNEGFAYIKTNYQPWTNVDGVCDAYTSKFMVNGIKNAFGEDNNESFVWGTYANYILVFSGSTETCYNSVPGIPDSQVSNINRPMYFAPGNTCYLGYCYIWKLPYGDTAWSRAFNLDPINYDPSNPTHVFIKYATDFYIDPKDSNNAYVLYRDAAIDGNGNPKDPSIDTFGKLYVSFTTHATTPSWANVSPSICSTNNINSIAVDPNHTNRIWVAFGNINNGYVGANPDTMKNRVWFSSDYGVHWSDVSTGLSALPVNKLLYRKGSNDEIFAGTDVGVFQWNPATSSWQCFNNGMPPCIVMDMEFNYCAGKLRAATYGRGIWETPLDTIQVAATDTISGIDTLAGGNQYYNGSIFIKTGATLVITASDTVHIPKNGSIIVPPGAKLTVNHSEITNDCSQCFWGGIQAWGYSGTPQSTANDGWVVIEGGSTIQHALVGISNFNPLDSSASGGIIQCYSSNFVNNNNAVSFTSYHNWNTAHTTLSPNLSYFTSCTFLLDNNYKGNTLSFPMNWHVFLNDVDGGTFSVPP